MSTGKENPSKEDLIMNAIHDMNDLMIALRSENKELKEKLDAGCPECGASLASEEDTVE